MEKAWKVNFLHLINGALTFSYAVFFSTFALYLTQYFGISELETNAYIGLFFALNFGLHLWAGYLGDKHCNHWSLFLLACLMQAVGGYIISLQNQAYLNLGLGLFVMGCGINTTSIKCLLTALFEQDEHQAREHAFFINYSVVNAGFLLGFFWGGYYNIRQDFETLFNWCNVFNIGVVVFILAFLYFFEKSNNIKKIFMKDLKTLMFYVLPMTALVTISFSIKVLSNILISLLGCIAVAYIIWASQKINNNSARLKVRAFITLTLISILFWSLFYIGPMGMTYFLAHNVNSHFWEIKIPPQWFMNFNAIFVILGSPFLSHILRKARVYGYRISTSNQFSWSLIMIALSFMVLGVGVFFADTTGYVASFWIILHFMFQAIGEVLIAPVGLSLVGKLAPKELHGIMMGLWMMISGLASTIANYLSDFIVPTGNENPIVTNPDYMCSFNNLGIIAALCALVIVFYSKKIEMLIDGRLSKTTMSLDAS